MTSGPGPSGRDISMEGSGHGHGDGHDGGREITIFGWNGARQSPSAPAPLEAASGARADRPELSANLCGLTSASCRRTEISTTVSWRPLAVSVGARDPSRDRPTWSPADAIPGRLFARLAAAGPLDI